MLQGTVSFPGITSIVEATISFVHGIRPSKAILRIKPQIGFIGEGGTLAFHFGDTHITFPDCKVDRNSLYRNAQGEVWRLSILDRRWKWEFGTISGSYNLREDDGTVRLGTDRTPQELARLCFEAMNEQGFSLAELPNDARPEVQWDYDVPMEALAQLCDDLGCRIVLGLDNKVRILKVGEGAELPNDGMLANSLTIDPPERPHAIAIVCGRTRYQVEFELEAVGLDTDGKIKPIASLSYKPAAGWGDDLLWFNNVNALSGVVAQTLARQTVYRWYRISVPLFNGILVPGYPEEVFDLNQIAIEAEQVATIIENDIKRNRPAIVHGVWFPEFLDGNANTESTLAPQPKDTEIEAAYRRGYGIDTKNKLVKFSQPVYRNTTPTGTTLTIDAAQLRLLTACNVKDFRNRAWQRYVWERNLGGPFTQTRHARHDEIVVSFLPTYNDGFAVTKLDDNKVKVDVECEHYLDGIEQEYQQRFPRTISYMGLRKIELDGAIQHIVFHVGKNFATTTIARNNEILHRTLPYKERRRREKERKQAEQLEKVGELYRWDPIGHFTPFP